MALTCFFVLPLKLSSFSPIFLKPAQASAERQAPANSDAIRTSSMWLSLFEKQFLQ
jgi:hypothetical protein